MTDLAQLIQDFRDDHGHAPVIVIHPDDWDELCGWFGTGTVALPASRTKLEVGDSRVLRSRDVERGRPELL